MCRSDCAGAGQTPLTRGTITPEAAPPGLVVNPIHSQRLLPPPPTTTAPPSHPRHWLIVPKPAGFMCFPKVACQSSSWLAVPTVLGLVTATRWLWLLCSWAWLLCNEKLCPWESVCSAGPLPSDTSAQIGWTVEWAAEGSHGVGARNTCQSVSSRLREALT